MKAIILLLLVPFSLGLARADIRPEYSGAWYNPEQSGHGLSIEVLSTERSIAFWFAYTPDGLPMFLVIDGVNTGSTVSGPAYSFEGMIWREFDPALLRQEVWGEVSIEFAGCDRALLTWSSSVPGYGEGEIKLQRLTYLAGLECEEVPAELIGEWRVQLTENPGVTYPGGLYPVTINADGTFEFQDATACLWEGQVHVDPLETGYLTAVFGSPTCPMPVPMLEAVGQYYADGVTFCGSGGTCVDYAQAIALVSEWYEMRTFELTFLR